MHDETTLTDSGFSFDAADTTTTTIKSTQTDTARLPSRLQNDDYDQYTYDNPNNKTTSTTTTTTYPNTTSTMISALTFPSFDNPHIPPISNLSSYSSPSSVPHQFPMTTAASAYYAPDTTDPYSSGVTASWASGAWSTVPAWDQHGSLYQYTQHYHDSHDDSHVVFPATDGRERKRWPPGTRRGNAATAQRVSKESAEKVSYVFVIILIPCLSIFGSVGNILSLIVLVHQRMRNATNTLLAALAISDLLVLLHAAYFSFLRIYKLKNPEQGNNLRTLTFPILGPYSSVITARITTWLTTMLSLERLVAVYCPMTAKTRCSRTTTAAYIALIYVITPLLFLPTAFKYHSCPQRIGNATKQVMALTAFGQNKPFFAIYGNILNVLFRLVPIVILIVVNSLIALAIKRVWSLRQSLSHSSTPTATSSFEQTRITMMLVTVSTVFLVCILPGAVHSIYTQIDKQYTRFGSQSNLYNVVATVTYFLETLNSSVNFFIYMAFSRKFSRTYREIFCCGRGGDEIPRSNIRSIFKFSLRGSRTPTNTSSKGEHLLHGHARKHQHQHQYNAIATNYRRGADHVAGSNVRASSSRAKHHPLPVRGTSV